MVRRVVGHAREGAFNSLLHWGLLEPKTAALLLWEQNSVNHTALQRRAKGWLGD